MEHTICHFEIPSDNLEASRAFYGQLFGWTIEAAPQRGDAYQFIRTSQEQPALGGGLVKRNDESHQVTLYVTVASIDETGAKLEQLGGKIVVPKTAICQLGWVLTAIDPQGNSIGLFQRDAQAARD